MKTIDWEQWSLESASDSLIANCQAFLLLHGCESARMSDQWLLCWNPADNQPEMVRPCIRAVKEWLGY